MTLYRHDIPGGSAWSTPVRAGRLITLTALGQGANLSVLLVGSDRLDRLNVPDTLKAQMSACIRVPMVLMSDRGLALASVVESFQVQRDTVKHIGGSGQVVKVRDEYLPVVELERVFGVPRLDAGASNPVMVVVEAEGHRAALLVDELLGQQQVVVKNLEANYRRVSDVSGATIMGDGRVALILDVASLARRTRH